MQINEDFSYRPVNTGNERQTAKILFMGSSTAYVVFGNMVM